MRMEEMEKRVLVLVLGVVFLLIPGLPPAAAFTTVAADTKYDCDISSSSEDGEHLVVFFEDDGEYNAAQARRVDANGAPIDPVIDVDERICGGGTGWSEPIAVAYNSQDDEYFVVWADLNPDDDDSCENGQIKAVRIDARTGGISGGPYTISDDPGNADQEWEPDVAYNSRDNTYLVVWVNETQDAMVGRLVNADGTTSGGVQTYESGDVEDDVGIAHSPTDNQFLVVWEMEWDDAADIRGRYAGNEGAPLGNSFAIDGAPVSEAEEADDPTVAWGSTHNTYLVVWENGQRFSSGSASSDEQILGRIVQGDLGGVSGSNIHITPRGAEDGDEDDRSDPHAAFCPYGKVFLAVFENGDKDSVEGRYLTAEGGVTERIFTIAPDPDPTNEDQRDDPRTAYNSTAQQFVTVFEHEYDSLAYQDIEAQVSACQGFTIVPSVDVRGMLSLVLIIAVSAVWTMARRRRKA